MDGDRFKMGWMLVVFDLPVSSPSQQKRAAGFRKFLLDQGYLMIQYSVYARACVSYNRMQTQMRRLKMNIPAEGLVHGPPPKEEPPEAFPEQLLFW